MSHASARKGLQTSVSGKRRPHTAQKKHSSDRIIRVNKSRR